jgi:hypothetical protein
MRLTDQQVISAGKYGRIDGDYVEEALATEVLESRAEIARRIIERDAAIYALGEWVRKAGAAEARVTELEAQLDESRAEIARLREALIVIRREQQSEAQAGTGEYQRGYDDCIAAHAEIARAALGRDAT